MAKLSQKEVLHVAKLAKLTLTPQEIALFQKQLSEIVLFIGQLAEVGTKNIPPTSQTTGLTDVYRLDKRDISNDLGQKQALSGAGKTKNGFFAVERILKKDS